MCFGSRVRVLFLCLVGIWLFVTRCAPESYGPRVTRWSPWWSSGVFLWSLRVLISATMTWSSTPTALCVSPAGRSRTGRCWTRAPSWSATSSPCWSWASRTLGPSSICGRPSTLWTACQNPSGPSAKSPKWSSLSPSFSAYAGCRTTWWSCATCMETSPSIRPRTPSGFSLTAWPTPTPVSTPSCMLWCPSTFAKASRKSSAASSAKMGEIRSTWSTWPTLCPGLRQAPRRCHRWTRRTYDRTNVKWLTGRSQSQEKQRWHWICPFSGRLDKWFSSAEYRLPYVKDITANILKNVQTHHDIHTFVGKPERR